MDAQAVVRFCREVLSCREKFSSENRVDLARRLVADSGLTERKSDCVEQDVFDAALESLAKTCELRTDLFGDFLIRHVNTSGQFVELVFWRNNTTAIHDHGFSGIFVPVLGRRECSDLVFRESKSLKDSTAVGQLYLSKKSCPRIGSINKISKDLLHQVSHPTPSITLVIRDGFSGDQSDYFPNIRIPAEMCQKGFVPDWIDLSGELGKTELSTNFSYFMDFYSPLAKLQSETRPCIESYLSRLPRLSL